MSINEKKLSAKSLVIILLTSFALFAFIFFQYGLHPIDFGKFLIALLVVVYSPGQTILWLAKIKVSRLEMVTLALILGMISSTLIYRISGITKFWPLFLAWLLGLLFLFCIKLTRQPPKFRDFSITLRWKGVVFLLIALSIFFILMVDNYRNGIVQENGSLSLNMHYLDGFIRNAVARELSHSIPPQMPFAAGYPLSYHYGMDLFVSIFYKHLDIGVTHLFHRLIMTFYFALLLMAVFTFSKRWMGSEKAAFFSEFMVVFASGGFGFLGGLLSDYAPYWGKLFYSFYLLDLLSLNSFLPSLSILVAGLFCFMMYLERRKVSWMILASFMFSIIIDYKMTFIAPILGALILTGLLFLWRFKETAPLKVLAVTLIMTAPLFVLAYLHNQGGPQYTPRINFNNWIIFPLVDLKLKFLARAWGDLIQHTKLTPTNLLLFFPILFGFFVGSFGLSFLALPRMFKKLFTFEKSEVLKVFLIFVFCGGLIYFFFFNPSLDGQSKNWTNIYVYYLSVFVLLLFWSETFMSFLKNKKRGIGIMLSLSVIFLSVPNDIHFLWAKVCHPQKMIIDESFLETCRWLTENSEEDAVIIHSQATYYVCYYADRRVVLDQSPHSYLNFHLTAKQIGERQKEIKRFFEDPILNADVLTKYNVSQLWAKKDRDLKGIKTDDFKRIDCFFFFGGEKIKKYLRSHTLYLAFERQDYSIYNIKTYKKEDQEVYVMNEKGQLKRFTEFFEKYP